MKDHIACSSVGGGVGSSVGMGLRGVDIVGVG